MPPAGARGSRRLNRTLGVDWDEPPSTLLDVEVTIVYRDGTRETVPDDYLSLAEEGVVVEGFPLAEGKRILQAEVDYNENIGPLTRLWKFLTNLDEEIRKTREEYVDWRRERRNR